MYFCLDMGIIGIVFNLGGDMVGWGFFRGYVDDKVIVSAGAYYWWNGVS